MSEDFPIYVITEKPFDFPNSYVCRRHFSCADCRTVYPTDYIIVAPTLEMVRSLLNVKHPGLVRIERDPTDDPVIVESWV